MNRINRVLYFVLIGLSVSWAQQVSAMTVQELHKKINSGERLTIIDIRNLSAYKRSHIPSSINIPAALMTNKKLPPLGSVVVYGDGVHTEKAYNAAASLNQKRGIQADVLEGGMATWKSFNMPDTQAVGMDKAVNRYITYQELLGFDSENADIVLVDLRLPQNDQVLSDIALQFPSVEVLKPKYRINKKNNKKSKFRLRSLIKRKKGRVPPLFILIDNGDGLAEKAYRRLGAGNIKRLAILAGGELILSRQGESGEQNRIERTSGELQ